jgi:hypothetical protein
VIALAFALAVPFAAPAGCVGTDANQVTGPVVLGMNSTVAPTYDDGQTKIFTAQTAVPLPIRRPTDDDLKGRMPVDPFPRSPWLVVDDVRLEMRFTLSNLDDDDHTVELLVDPWNEFVRYRPGLVVGRDNATPDLSGYDRRFIVPGKSRVEGVLTPDDMRELAVDLATAQQIVAHPPGMDASVDAHALVNRAFNVQNRSNDGDPLLTPRIPAVIPGLTGFDLGLRMDQAADVAIEVTIDVTDQNGNRTVPASKTDPFLGPPGNALSTPKPTAM